MKHLDKITHFLAGYLIFDIALLLGGIEAGCFFVFFFAIVKEIIDGIRGGNPDAWDVVATLGGGVLGFLIYLIK